MYLFGFLAGLFIVFLPIVLALVIVGILQIDKYRGV